MKTNLFSLTLILGFLALGSFPLLERTMPVSGENFGATRTNLPYYYEGYTCIGEFVAVVGTVEIVHYAHSDGNGGYHLVDNVNVKAEGIGSYGTPYKVNFSTNYTLNIGAGGLPYTLTTPMNFNAIGKGNAPNVKLQGVLHLTFNENGVLTAYVQTEKMTCKPVFD